MKNVVINLKVDEGAELPNYNNNKGNSGCDLRALGILDIYYQDGSKPEPEDIKHLDELFKSDKEIEIGPHCRVIFDSGVTIANVNSYFPIEGQVRPRSGISIKTPIQVMLGTIDESYRGKIGIIAVNNSNNSYTVYYSERIAQLVFVPVVKPLVIQSDNIVETERGSKGFGSSGTF